MTSTTDGTCVVKMKYSDEKISAVLAESRQARKHLRKLGKVAGTVAAYRLNEMKSLQAVEKLATWRRACGFDQLAEGDDSWIHGTLPPAPGEFTASLWSDVKALKDVISMPSIKDRSSQREKSFIQGIERGTVSFSDVQFARLKRFVGKRDRDAAHVTVAPVSTAQYRSPHSPPPEMLFDTRVHMEKKSEDSEKKNESMMDPKRDQLKPLSLSTGLETPGQQCPSNGKTGRTTADGCLLVGVGSNLGGNIFFGPTAKAQHRLQHQTPFF